MSIRKVYKVSTFQIAKAFGAHGMKIVAGRDCSQIRESMESGQAHVMAGLKFQPIKDNKFRVYDIRERVS